MPFLIQFSLFQTCRLSFTEEHWFTNHTIALFFLFTIIICPCGCMLIFDALICNEDRHFGNFRLMVDNRTNRPYAFAPLFDHGLSLFNYAMPDNMKNPDEYAKTRSSSYGVPFENIVREFISPRQKEKLRKMIGFKLEKHSAYNLPADRLKAVEGILQRRVQAFLDVPDRG